jgi:hypothetical protein
MIQQELIDHIKNILVSHPVDIFNEELESVSHSSFELVEPRDIEDTDEDFEDDDDDEDDEDVEDSLRRIGSVNVFIAAAILCDEVTQGRSIQKLNEVDSAKFESAWRSLINQLKEERFIRETQLVAHSKIKLVVDNDKLPKFGA